MKEAQPKRLEQSLKKILKKTLPIGSTLVLTASILAATTCYSSGTGINNSTTNDSKNSAADQYWQDAGAQIGINNAIMR